MPDISAEIARQRKLLGPGPKTFHVYGGGTFTSPVVLEKFENLHMHGGLYDKATSFGEYAIGAPMIAPKGYNTIRGDGRDTILVEPVDLTSTSPTNQPTAILTPYWNTLLNPSSVQPMFHNIHVENFQVRGNRAVNGDGSKTLMSVGNVVNGGFEKIYLNGVHCIGLALGGSSNPTAGPYNIKGFGRRQYIRFCEFVGGNDSETADAFCGVMTAVVNTIGWQIHNNNFERIPNGNSAIDIEVTGDEDKMEMGLISDNNIEIIRDVGGSDAYRDHEYDGNHGNYPAADFDSYGIIIHSASNQTIGPIKVVNNQIRGAWNKPGTVTPSRNAIFGIYCPGPYSYLYDISNNTIDSCGVAIHWEGSHGTIQGNHVSHGGSMPAGAIRCYGRHAKVNHNIVDFYSNASGAPYIEEIVLPGRETFTDWNDLSDNWVDWNPRAQGTDPLEPLVRLAKESNPAHAPNSTKGGKSGSNRHMRYDPNSWRGFDFFSP